VCALLLGIFGCDRELLLGQAIVTTEEDATVLPDTSPPLPRCPEYVSAVHQNVTGLSADGAMGELLVARDCGVLFDTRGPGAEGSLHFTNGSVDGTERLADAGGFTAGFAVGEELTVVAGQSLWVTDGTPEGTAALFGEQTAVATTPVPYRDGLVFSAGDASEGFEPFFTDGTAEGTYRFAELEVGPDPSDPLDAPRGYVAWGDSLFFFGAGGLFRAGADLATVDLVAPLSVPRHLPTPVGVGATLVFAATDGVSLVLWGTDGTPEGTVRLSSLTVPVGGGFPTDSSVRLLGTAGKVYVLITTQPSADPEALDASAVYVSDGTAAGTRLLQAFGGSDPRVVQSPAVITRGSIVFFRSTDGEGASLWRTDGTEVATVELMGFVGVPTEPFVSTSLGLLFAADDGVTGEELWATDGTTDGTRLVADLVPGLDGGMPRGVMEAGGHIVMFADTDDSGFEPRILIGGGLQNIGDLLPGPLPDVGPRRIVGTDNGTLYFVAPDEHSTQLYRYVPGGLPTS
jgi:ELWxxDGT repeat protein